MGEANRDVEEGEAGRGLDQNVTEGDRGTFAKGPAQGAAARGERPVDHEGDGERAQPTYAARAVRPAAQSLAIAPPEADDRGCVGGALGQLPRLHGPDPGRAAVRERGGSNPGEFDLAENSTSPRKMKDSPYTMATSAAGI